MKTQKTFLKALFLTVLPTLTVVGHAKAAELVSVGQVSALARAAIQAETLSLNTALAGGENSDYYESQLEAIRRTGANRLADDYLFDKCVYNDENLLSMLDSQLTLADDATAGRGTALSRLQGLYGKNVWRAASQACSNAEARFQARLRTLTAQGKALALDDDTVEALTSLLFYPTRIGRPHFRTKLRAIVGTIFTAAVFIGSTSSLIGLPVGKLIMSFAVPANAFLGLRNQLGGHPAPLRPDAQLLLDLNAEEHPLVLP